MHIYMYMYMKLLLDLFQIRVLVSTYPKKRVLVNNGHRDMIDSRIKE